jgi:ribosomal protein S18 acetylase RimI-like enzyme
MTIRTYQQSDHDSIIALWKECGLIVPQNDPSKDIARKVDHSPELFFVGEQDGEIVASAMAGYDGHRGAVNYLAVKLSLQGFGLGRMMMEHVEKQLRSLGCAKINLNVRTSNLKVVQFYESIGFRRDDVVSMGKRFEFDQHSF